MNDTVYRQAAIEAMCAACKDWCDEGVCQKVSALQRLLSADPVIRCKDCEYYHRHFVRSGVDLEPYKQERTDIAIWQKDEGN